MRLDRLETHDRYAYFTKQKFDISECCQDLINKRPFGNHAFYIFAHARTIEMDERIALFNQDHMNSLTDIIYVRKYTSLSQVPSKTLIWQPRMTKPKAQSNSMCFKAYPGTDVVKVLWIIPAIELWGQYKKGNITENKIVRDSIAAYQHDRAKLEAKEDDDLNDDQIKAIYKELGKTWKMI